MNFTLNQDVQLQRTLLAEVFKSLHQLTLSIHNVELAEMVNELQTRLYEPFMFVVVGEVKAGKSSFINALLNVGKEICKVAPDPCTHIVQQIIYGEPETTVRINPHLERKQLTIDILRDIAIVDTPGTGAIIAGHQEITKQFIPLSDLIIFVFPARNPFHQSTWEFFDFVNHEWQKKIIFVMQQADTMDEDEISVNKNWVINYAHNKGIEQPQVFCVSAKWELKGKTAESGFTAIRQYIQDNVTGSKAFILKMQNNIITAKNLQKQLHNSLNIRLQQLQADQLFRRQVKEILTQQATRSNNEVSRLVENVQISYARTANEMKHELKEKLSFFKMAKRAFWSALKRDNNINPNSWLDDFKENLRHELTKAIQNKLNEGTSDIAYNIQQMAQVVEFKIRNNQKNALINNDKVFNKIAENRSGILQALKDQFEAFATYLEQVFIGGALPEHSFSRDAAIGGSLAATGALLAFLTQGAVFDITGGIVTTIGLFLAGGSFWWNSSKILAVYDEKITAGSDTLGQELNTKLQSYIHQIKTEIENNFQEFDAYLCNEEKEIADITQQLQLIHNNLHAISQGIQS